MINYEDDDQIEQEQRREFDQAQLRDKSARGQNRKNGSSGPMEKLSTPVKEGLRTMMTGKLLKGKSTFMKVMIVTAAIVSLFAGVGVKFLAQCFQEEPILTLLVIIFWILVIFFILMAAVLLVLYFYCESFIGAVTSKAVALVTEMPDFCSIFKLI